ncbi:uncharacterized protein BX664DRAFT_255802 [Halteromyces radiatus]|uniref:uncharacterized protein n=1 Tax=Halteromyces radiatus TaxID=101107 RepID=UPI00221E64FB|nr:uncharacterized protein BX664DRAFT_255802 [Halteromyces radiatus]KAI8098544.1 hypothetical protein BX664DRAFT_255802 [Halteromyces radiatus]
MKLAWDYLSSGFTNFSIPFNIQKRLHKYLLWKTIGSYLATELNQDNFDFELVNGSFELRDVDLNLDTLNDKLIDTPFVLTQGRASIIKGKMPWSNWSGEISFKIQGLDLILKPSKEKRTRKHDSPVMSSSLHFADDFLKTEMETDQSQELYESIQQLQEQPSTDIGDAGLQALTLVIEKLAAMLKVDIIDTAIHIVHPSAVSLAGDSSRSAGYNKEYSLDIEIPKISYFDETPGFSGNINNPTTVPTSNMIESSILIPNSGDELIKIVTIASPKIWIRSCLDSDLFQHEQSFSSMMSGSITPRAFPSVHNESIDKPYEALLFTTMDKENWIRFKARYLSPFNAEATSPPPSTGAAKNIDFYISHIRTMITPNQLGFLLDLLSAATTTPLTDSPPHSKPTMNQLDPYQDLSRRKNHQTSSSKQQSSSPEIKIKLQVPLMEHFFLYNDESLESSSTWTSSASPPTRNTSHLKVWIRQLIIRLQKFPSHHLNKSTVNNRIKSMSGMRESLLSRTTSGTKMKYYCYLPILEFNDAICSDYDSNQKFPSYIPQPLTTLNQGQTSDNQQSRPKKDVIRIRLEKRNTSKVNSIYDAKEYQQGIQAKVRIAFIRTQLSIPDMSQCSTRDEFNDHLHDDTLSVDVHKINAGWMTGNKNNLSKHQPQRITVDLDSINVFLKQSQELQFYLHIYLLHLDPLARCWFTAKSQGKQGSLSSVSLSPSMEITIRSSSSETFHPPPSARSGYFGTGSDIPNNLFEHLSRNETLHSEQKMYVPVEDQAESSMMFKQRTVETSMIVLNCHFPITYLTLSNQTWAKIQILQNDLILWQPRIMTYLGKDQNRTDSSTTVSSSSEMFRTASYRRHSDMESSHTSVLSQSVWDLHTNKNQSSSAYRLQFTDFRYFAVIKHLGLNENITTLDIEDLTLDDISDDARKVPLFYRTLPKSLTPRRNTSMVSLFSRLTTIPELNKQNKITSIVVCNICWRFSPNIDFIDNLIDFQKTPDDMVFIDPPTQYIKVYAHVLDTSVDYKPKSIPSRAVVVVDNLQVVTDILAGQPLIDVKTYIQNVDMFLVDDVNDLDETHAQQTTRNWDARRFWSMIGMANVLHSRNLESQVKLKLDDILPIPDIEVTIMNDILTLESCADSFQSLVNFITYATNDGDRIFTSQQQQQYTTTKTPYKSTKKPVKRSHTTLVKTKEDMLSSLDEEAFKHRHVPPSTTPSRHQTPIEDNLMLIEEYYSKAESSSIMTQSSLRPRKPRRKHNRIQKSPEDIIRILSTELQEFDIVENFYSIDNTNKAPRKQKLVDTRRSALSVRVRDVDIIWKLYSGNDWDYIRSSMGSQGGGNTSASTSTSSIATSTTTMGNASTSASRRSGTDMELRIEGIIFELDMMVPEEQTRLHGHLEIRDVEIVDNIKTSSWDTFFGCMRPESPSSLPRETGSYMVVVDIIGVRPVVQDMTVEYRLGIQTLPLRLFIDQDALNFLVQFFAFNPSILRSTPGSQAAMIPSSSTTNGISHDPGSIPSSSSLPFQHEHVEIYPIDLKIDYKPKYINYDNIKEGQFAELVNLFQLEGAKLNLSAVKLTGIKGIPKLMERLGQEWLPHIKNTQVPHMVSGVSPIRSMVSLGSGIADLVLLPIQQYRKDGRVIKGIQKGTQSFARTTAMELIKLSARLASGTQVILEHADGFLSSQQQQQQQQQQQHGDRGLDSRDGMVSSSSSPISTVIGSRTSEDMVFVFTDRNLGLDEDV